MSLQELRNELARKQKMGLPFIAASAIIWLLIWIVCRIGLPVEQQNMLVFCCSCPMMPFAWGIGKMLHVDLFDKSNELYLLGFLFTLNQLLYLLIVMWVFKAVPEKMVMVYAMVFGAHLLPYSWLYQSLSYRIAAILIPIVSLTVGCLFPSRTVAALMLVTELVFTGALSAESKRKMNREEAENRTVSEKENSADG